MQREIFRGRILKSVSSGVALVVGIGFGLLLIVGVSLWVIVQGKLPLALVFVSFAVLIFGSTALAVLSGSLQSAILLTLGIGVGVALSSIITLPHGR